MRFGQIFCKKLFEKSVTNLGIGKTWLKKALLIWGLEKTVWIKTVQNFSKKCIFLHFYKFFCVFWHFFGTFMSFLALFCQFFTLLQFICILGNFFAKNCLKKALPIWGLEKLFEIKQCKNFPKSAFFRTFTIFFVFFGIFLALLWAFWHFWGEWKNLIEKRS